jgi:hypothetical protein
MVRLNCWVFLVDLFPNISNASRVGWVGPVFYFYKNIQKGQWQRALSGFVDDNP